MKRLVVLVVAVAALAAPAAALAHPLGNFTINRYSRVQVSGNRIDVLYVLDMAEIPAFRERQTMGSPTAYAATTARRIARGLDLEVAGRGVTLAPVRQEIAFPPGQGGLQTLRLQALFSTGTIARSDAPLALAYRDSNYAGRIGWKEIVVRATGDARLGTSSAPSTSLSGELLAYPKNLLQSPPDVTAVQATFEPGTQAAAAPRLLDARELGERVVVRATADGGFASLIAHRDLSLGFVLVSLLIALFWGAAHALSPGHGKSIVAGYLVGTRGRARDAVALGLIVTVTHTAGVFTLGGITLLLSAFIVPEQLYPWLNLVSALLVVGVGLSVLRWRVREWRHHRAHAHGHDHDHEHDHALSARRATITITTAPAVTTITTTATAAACSASASRPGSSLARPRSSCCWPPSRCSASPTASS